MKNQMEKYLEEQMEAGVRVIMVYMGVYGLAISRGSKIDLNML